MIQSLLGLFLLTLLGWLLSEDRAGVRWRVPAAGLVLQFALALLLIKAPVLRDAFLGLNQALLALQEATRAGTSFVFGYVGGAELPFEELAGASSFVLAFQALPGTFSDTCSDGGGFYGGDECHATNWYCDGNVLKSDKVDKFDIDPGTCNSLVLCNHA